MEKAQMGQYPMFTIEDLSEMSVKEVADVLRGNFGQELHSWCDVILVEEIVNAAARETINVYDCDQSVANLLGEDGLTEARKIADFRAKLRAENQPG